MKLRYLYFFTVVCLLSSREKKRNTKNNRTSSLKEKVKKNNNKWSIVSHREPVFDCSAKWDAKSFRAVFTLPAPAVVGGLATQTSQPPSEPGRLLSIHGNSFISLSLLLSLLFLFAHSQRPCPRLLTLLLYFINLLHLIVYIPPPLILSHFPCIFPLERVQRCLSFFFIFSYLRVFSFVRFGFASTIGDVSDMSLGPIGWFDGFIYFLFLFFFFFFFSPIPKLRCRCRFNSSRRRFVVWKSYLLFRCLVRAQSWKTVNGSLTERRVGNR